MCQVNGGVSFSATLGSESPEQIHLKFGTFDYVHSRTHMQNTVTAEIGSGVGIWVKLYPRVLF